MKYIAIKNWKSFQHYTDRSPPWIKLHRELLTSETWVTLDDASRVLAIAIMLLAAANENKIPNNKAYIKRAAYLNADPEIQPLLDIGFIEIIEENENSASTLQANARPEERREEKRREEEKKIRTLEELEKHPLDGFVADWFKTGAPRQDRFSVRQDLVLYCKSKPKKYADYWAALQSFARKAEAKLPKIPKSTEQDENWSLIVSSQAGGK